MTTSIIIDKLNKLTIEHSEDYDHLEVVDELTNYLRQNSDGYLACEALINLLERHPEVEFGTPGEPVHTLETLTGYYEEFLLKSLEKHPTQMTVWMLNRMMNGQEESYKKTLIQILNKCIMHPLADQQTIAIAKDCYDYQTGS